MFINTLFSALVADWKSEDTRTLPSIIDVIVPLSYNTLPRELCSGTRAAFMKALELKQWCPGALFMFVNCAHSGFPGCAQREYELKKEILAAGKGRWNNHWPDSYICAGEAVNSVTEAETIRTMLVSPPKRILVVCGEIHSHSVRSIWEKVFPDTQIIIRCFPHTQEYQKDHPFFVVRSSWVYFATRVVRQVLLRTIGVRNLGKLSHRAS